MANFDLTPQSYRLRRQVAASRLYAASRVLFAAMTLMALVGAVVSWRTLGLLESRIAETRGAMERLLTSEILRLKGQRAQLDRSLDRGRVALEVLEATIPLGRCLAQLEVALEGVQVDRLFIGPQGLQIQGKVPGDEALATALDRLSGHDLYGAFEVLDRRRDYQGLAFTLWGSRRSRL